VIVSEAQTLLARYVGANDTFLERLNLVRARLLQQGNWPDCTRLVKLSPEKDRQTGYSVILMPSDYSTVLAAAIAGEGESDTDGSLTQLLLNIMQGNTTSAQSGDYNATARPIPIRNMYENFNANGSDFGDTSWALQELPRDFEGRKRYRVPISPGDGYACVLLVKLGYSALTLDWQEVIPNNVGALKAGLQALLAEDADNRGLSRELWAEAMELLAEQAENDMGAGAEGGVEIRDDLQLSSIGGIL